MAPQAKWLQQRVAHRNSVQEDGPESPISVIWTRFVEEFLELKNLGQNVRDRTQIHFQNDADQLLSQDDQCMSTSVLPG